MYSGENGMDSHDSFHFERPRLSQLFTSAVKYPLVVVCAGAGYGKTSAVHDFAQEYQATTFWLQFSERDNSSARFWESYIHALANVNAPFAEELKKMGFPDTKEKQKNYHVLLNNLVEKKRRIIVMDDFHCVEDASVIRFIEECIIFKMPPGTSVFLVSRTIPNIKTTDNSYKKKIYNINEDDLHFTENELSQYFRSRNISLPPESLREIMQDTGGWAFAINFVAQSYQKVPGYSGYVRNALRTNVFGLIEEGLWNEISAPLQNFLLRLSLIDHLSVDLLTQLAAGDANLIAEFEKLNAYVRRDNYINAYFIHPLFLEFLRTKQKSLPEEQQMETYTVAGDWCAKNGFKIDAIFYFEKTGNYQSILLILAGLTTKIPLDIAKYAAMILDRAPEDAFDRVDFLADMHLRTYICQGLLQESLDLVKRYETKFMKLPDNNPVKKRTLTRLYICWTYIRCLMSVTDNIFDYDIYVEKACKYVHEADSGKLDIYYPGAWINYAGSSKKGSLEEFISAITRNQAHISRSYMKGFMAGELELAHGELKFYRGDASSAATHTALAAKQARADKQFGIMHRALLYSLRIAAAQGNFALTEQTLKDTKAQLDEAEYLHRFMDYDISFSWYYYFLGLPEKMADWLKEDFSQYTHSAFIENFGNQIKARFFYATRNYSPLLSYIEEMKERESFLYGRVEMLTMEACVHYKMKNKEKAFAVFQEAYETASPNEIVMPFIELGKDMRTLTSAVLKESSCKIPKSWLEDINHKSATYAKRRSHVIAQYTQVSGLKDNITMSPRETEILTDISHGLSRAEIAATRKLSPNTVKMVINNIRYKLGAENVADLIRIAVEKKLIL
ncbi:MAG: LuxR C-terminal-related transcriptional regulator [Treponema sp.]|jgi:LuxR family maltose regulon positive regulatory protein|nr:LuxR C-terminal-related transcriptional regulator [Treponema sp.]